MADEMELQARRARGPGSPIDGRDAFRCIAMFENSEMPFLYPDLARMLRKEYGARIVLFAKNETNARHYRSVMADCFDEIRTYQTPLSHFKGGQCVGLDQEGDIIERARAIEKTLNRTINSLRINDRQLGRGFMLAGPGHPRTRSESLFTDHRALASYVLTIEEWLALYESYDFSLIIDGPVWTDAHCRVKNIPWRKFLPVRHKSFNYWMTAFTGESAMISETFAQLSATPAEPDAVEMPHHQYDLAYTLDRTFKKTNTFTRMLWSSALIFARFGHSILRGYESAWGYLPTSNTAYLFRRWRDARLYQRQNVVSLESYDAKDYVLFPLQMEPELSLQGFSPEFFFQHTAIAIIAKSLPAGVRLVVKEHKYGLGRRPPRFYQEIKKLGNVDFADLYESGFNWVRKAKAVACISSSAGFEAAIMGVPVVCFGLHNIYSSMHHAFICQTTSDADNALTTIFNGGVDRSKAEQEGRLLIQAVERASVDMGDYSKAVRSSYDDKLLRRIADNLLQSTGSSQPITPHTLQTSPHGG